MSTETPSSERNRFNKIVEMKERALCYEPLREAIVNDLKSDEQFRHLLVLSEHTRRLIEIRGSQVGCDDPMRGAVTEFGEVVDEELHRRADEIVTKIAASYVRQDDRWMIEDPDAAEAMDMNAAFEGIDESLRWLKNHEEIVERLAITYPEDEW